jgi:hypothetical protein
LQLFACSSQRFSVTASLSTLIWKIESSCSQNSIALSSLPLDLPSSSSPVSMVNSWTKFLDGSNSKLLTELPGEWAPILKSLTWLLIDCYLSACRDPILLGCQKFYLWLIWQSWHTPIQCLDGIKINLDILRYSAWMASKSFFVLLHVSGLLFFWKFVAQTAVTGLFQH